MRVLLINSNREHSPWPAAPIGLSMVATATEAAGHEVSFADLAFVRNPAAEARRRAIDFAPDVIGVSIRNLDNCNFDAPRFYLDEVRDDVVRVVRAAVPDAKVVIGGAAVNLAPWNILHHVEADYALAGEGEEALPSFLAALGRGADLGRVPGLLDRRGPTPRTESSRHFGDDRILRGEPPTGRARIADFAARGASDLWRWTDWPGYRAHGAPYPVQTKRGCPLRCVYCAYNNIEGRAYRLRDPRLVADEIEQAVREHGVRSIDFVDSTFNLPAAHAQALCDELGRRKLGDGIELSTMGINPAAMPGELADAMRRAGFSNVMCTPESASNAMLKSLGKGFDREQVIRTAGELTRAGLKTLWFFMFGAPGETIETVKESLDFCERHLQPTDVALFTAGIRVYPGTPLEKQCKESGWFAPDDPLLRPSWYVAPGLGVADMYRLLIEGAIDHPNWMTAAEGVLHPGMVALVEKGYRLLGGKGPLWARMPGLFRTMSKVGVRKKLLLRMNDLLVARTSSQLPTARAGN